MQSLERWSGPALSLLRVMAALLFFEHGAMKILHFPTSIPGMPDPLPPLELAAGLMELVGGPLLAIGLFTRPVAFLLSGEMAVAYFMVHAKEGFFPAANMGDAAILFCFIFFFITFAGPGPFSVDALRRRSAN